MCVLTIAPFTGPQYFNRYTLTHSTHTPEGGPTKCQKLGMCVKVLLQFFCRVYWQNTNNLSLSGLLGKTAGIAYHNSINFRREIDVANWLPSDCSIQLTIQEDVDISFYKSIQVRNTNWGIVQGQCNITHSCDVTFLVLSLWGPWNWNLSFKFPVRRPVNLKKENLKESTASCCICPEMCWCLYVGSCNVLGFRICAVKQPFSHELTCLL